MWLFSVGTARPCLVPSLFGLLDCAVGVVSFPCIDMLEDLASVTRTRSSLILEGYIDSWDIRTVGFDDLTWSHKG